MSSDDTRARSNHLSSGLLLACALAFAAGAGCVLAAALLLQSFGPSGAGEIDGRLVERAAETIETNFVDPVDRRTLMIDALRGMVGSLDLHSEYISPQDYPSFVEETQGEYAGIGILLAREDEPSGAVRIDGILPGGPADRAGLRRGDLISWVKEETPAAEDSPAAPGHPIRDRLAGEPGTAVIVEVAGGGSGGGAGRSLAVRVVREEVLHPSIPIAAVADPERRTGYILIGQFQENTPREFEQAMDLLENQGVERLIIDLRGNPGGVFRGAIDVAAELLPEGAAIVTTIGRNGEQSRRTHSAPHPGRWRRIPLAVLVDGGTASAAEVVAAAIQDHRRGILIGNRTFGKGKVQTIFALGDPERAGLIKLTTQRFLTPAGRSIDRDGAETPGGDGTHPPAPPQQTAGAGNGAAGGSLDASLAEGSWGLKPDLEADLPAAAGFLEAFDRHSEEIAYEPWRREAAAAAAAGYRPFEWVDPADGSRHRDTQLDEAIACLADSDVYRRLLSQPSPPPTHQARSPGAASRDARPRY